MDDLAAEFLVTWTLQQEQHPPLSDHDAAEMAERWREDAERNGIEPAAVDAAAGGDLAAFLQRTFGREESESDLP